MSEYLIQYMLDSFESEDDLGIVLRVHIGIEKFINELIAKLVIDERHIKKIEQEY